MKSSTLLIAAVALAAGVIASKAQVYSQNIVGYVNAPMGGGYVNVAVPLDLSGGNTLTNIFQNPVAGGNGGPNGGTGPLDFTTVLLWNGAGYTIYTLDTDYASGVANSADSAQVTPPPTVNPGTLIFWNNNTGNAITNTLVGQVHTDTAAAGSESVGNTTNVLGVGYNFVASKLPIAGGISTVLGITNNVPGGNGGPNGGTGPLDFATVYIPNIVSGVFKGYTIITIDSDYPTGFANSADSAGVPEPQIPVGTGFIINNNTGNQYVWTQAL